MAQPAIKVRARANDAQQAGFWLPAPQAAGCSPQVAQLHAQVVRHSQLGQLQVQRFALRVDSQPLADGKGLALHSTHSAFACGVQCVCVCGGCALVGHRQMRSHVPFETVTSSGARE